jgi:hypothetical protein
MMPRLGHGPLPELTRVCRVNLSLGLRLIPIIGDAAIHRLIARQITAGYCLLACQYLPSSILLPHLGDSGRSATKRLWLSCKKLRTGVSVRARAGAQKDDPSPFNFAKQMK